MAHGRIVFVDEDDDPLAPMRGIFGVVIARLRVKPFDGPCKIECAVHLVIVFEPGRDKGVFDIFRECLLAWT